MKQTSAYPAILHRLAMIAATAAVAALATPTPARAQFVVAIVNGDPVTNYDIEQRSKLIQLGSHKAPPRQEVLDDLINDKLKVQLLKRYAIEGIDKDVDNAYANMARRGRTTPKEFTAQLAKAGVMPETLKSRIKADLIWNQIIRGRFQSSFQFSDKDIETRLEATKPPDANVVGYDYTLRPILLVVPRGSAREAVEARIKEAEALRARFQGCEEGMPLARSLRFVAIRPQVVKGSAEFVPAQREILTNTEIGRLTPPEVTREGVQLYALCGRKQSDNAPAKKEIRDQMYSETFANLAKTYMKELRSQAMIEYR